MSKSIICNEKECYFCKALDFAGATVPIATALEKHHIMYGFSSKARDYSEKYGLWVYLCTYHHRTGNESVHKSQQINIILRRIAEKAFLREHRENGFNEWMKLFGKNYLTEEERCQI